MTSPCSTQDLKIDRPATEQTTVFRCGLCMRSVESKFYYVGKKADSGTTFGRFLGNPRNLLLSPHLQRWRLAGVVGKACHEHMLLCVEFYHTEDHMWLAQYSLPPTRSHRKPGGESLEKRGGRQLASGLYSLWVQIQTTTCPKSKPLILKSKPGSVNK